MKTLDIADRIAASVIARREGRPALTPRDHKVWARRTYDMDGWETGEWEEPEAENEETEVSE